jgi:hypothetical protein
MTRWRKRHGKKSGEAIFLETIELAKGQGAIHEREVFIVSIDTTVQEKGIAYPTETRLYRKACERHGTQPPFWNRWRQPQRPDERRSEEPPQAPPPYPELFCLYFPESKLPLPPILYPPPHLIQLPTLSSSCLLPPKISKNSLFQGGLR